MEQIAALVSFCNNRGIECRENAPLRDFCTFKIGGNAQALVQPASAQELADVLRCAREHAVRTFVMGRGSNLLFDDDGFAGAVICLSRGMSRITKTGETTLLCESGASLAQLSRTAMEHGLTGLEFACGIPGTVGGAVYMNAGAHGGEIGDILVRACHLDQDLQPGTLSNEAAEFSYRHSVYMQNQSIITGAEFALQPGDREEIRARMDEIMRSRHEKQPLEYPSAGSTFKRPQGAFASALIDRCGLKGLRVGGAVVSEKHAGFVVNTGGATARDVKALIEQVRDEVHRQTGYRLECEVEIVK